MLLKKIFSYRFVLLFMTGIILPLSQGITSSISYENSAKTALPYRSSNFPEAFLNNDFSYNVKFLWFSNMAEARFFFKKGKKTNGYKAVLEGQTKGFIGWLTSNRKHRYTSTMELITTQKGPHLRSNHFLREIINGDEKETTSYILNHKDKQVTVRHSKTGMDDEVNHFEMPGNKIYEDLLSAYFNVKSGILGNIQKGSIFEIDTISRKKISKVKVTVIDDNAHGINELVEINNKASFIIKLELDKELFSQKNGATWIWTDINLIPLTGRIVDVIGFGDVWGTIMDDSTYFADLPESSK